MKKQFRYSIHITGVIPADSEEQASLIANMGYAINGRLLQSPNKILVAVEDVTEKVEEERSKQNGEI